MNADQTFIPSRLKVGFNERQYTFGNRLGYVIYFDENGKLRKNVSWENWRDENIEPIECDNEPTTGFVINRGITRKSYEWNSVAHKVRVHDPRGFEVEIDHNNMVAINIHCDVIKGEVKSPLVYMWMGKELWLLPVESDLYEKAKETTRKQAVKVKKGALVVGGMYSIKKSSTVVATYLGEMTHTTHQTGYFDGNTGRIIGESRAKNILKNQYHYNQFKERYDLSVKKGEPNQSYVHMMDHYSSVPDFDIPVFHGTTFTSSPKHIFLTNEEGTLCIEPLNIANIADFLGMENQDVVDKHISLYQENILSKQFVTLQKVKVPFVANTLGQEASVFFEKDGKLLTITKHNYAHVKNLEHRLINGKSFYVVEYPEQYDKPMYYTYDYHHVKFLFGNYTSGQFYWDRKRVNDENSQTEYDKVLSELEKLEFFTYEWVLNDGTTKSLSEAESFCSAIYLR